MLTNTERLSLARRLLALESRAQPSGASKLPESRSLTAEIEINALPDICHANPDASFQHVLHVFHQSWYGIRSACASLPGQKAAIPVEPAASPTLVLKIIDFVSKAKIEKVVFHGFSANSSAILNALEHLDIDSYLVWHGNVAQLAWDHEWRIYSMARQAYESRKFVRASVLKAGNESLFPASFEKILLNQPPKLPPRAAPLYIGESNTILVPAFNDIRKNLYASVLGSSLGNPNGKVLYYSIADFPPIPSGNTRKINYFGHSSHLNLLRQIDLVVNVTLIDCHPMVDVEALGAGTPSLTGPLWLDALRDHPYTKLTEVNNPFDLREIAIKVEYIFSISSDEISAIIADYSDVLRKISTERYKEFLFG